MHFECKDGLGSKSHFQTFGADAFRHVLAVSHGCEGTPNTYLLFSDAYERHLLLSAGLTEAWNKHAASHICFRTRALLLSGRLMKIEFGDRSSFQACLFDKYLRLP